ncbi:MAG: hypothetical protein A2X55_05540 [Nitrospirae bacterium GWB2_47_37]|nr:MAG: hypothetical protein A2X55_05540 [Nitrospirae bacterium GWB2_47_37]HAK87549.1 hypothetical protein [Nitrospiraceae bacterium]
MLCLKIFKKQAEGTGMGLKPAPAIDLSTPIDMCPYVVIDTELTGLNPKKDSIVSMGALKMSGGRIEVGNFYYRVVAPETELTGSSVVIHGITPSEAAEWPDIEMLLPEFYDYCKNSIIVGHFLNLDMSVINREMRRLTGRRFENLSVDTYKIYEWIKVHSGDSSRHFGANGNGDLFSIAKKYQIRTSEAHNALTDAFITAQLFQRFLSRLPGLGVRTLNDLKRIGKH